MPDDVRISELSPISSIGNNDLMEVSHEDSGAESGYVSTKMTMTQLSNKLNNNIQYVSDLETASKTIIGGINSLLANMTTPYANLSFPIAQGVCCSHDGLVYQANQAISTSEAWIPAHWTQVVLTDLIGSGGGGSGGHTILDDSGTALTQRANLQFKGAYSEDNSGDDTTEVNVVRSMTKAQYEQLSSDEKVGIINITDEDITATDLPISGNDPTDTKTYIDSAISALKNYSLTDYSTNIASNWNVITSSGCYAMKIGNVGIITIRIKTSASISSGSLTLSTLPFASPREIWGSLSSLDNKGGFIQLNGKELLIRCSASSDNFLAGQVVVPIST